VASKNLEKNNGKKAVKTAKTAPEKATVKATSQVKASSKKGTPKQAAPVKAPPKKSAPRKAPPKKATTKQAVPVKTISMKSRNASLSKIKTVGDFVEATAEHPRLARNTQNYISDMIDFFGRDVVFEGIYGLDEQIESLILYFHAHNTSLERRLLLLVGPQGAGKSYTVDKIKKHLDMYSHTDDGILFAVAGCPFHQHPFDMVPHAVRPELKDTIEFRWYPEAIPCPVCQQNIKKYGGWKELPVKRIEISTATKTGLAKHTPTDLRREDITNFIGNINFSKLKKIGSTYAPDAYDFEGKMIWANRGILDWTEIFKSRRQLLGLLLELIQSKRIDMTNFPTVHVDEVVIGHTNFPEYHVFLSEDIMEPLLGRIFKIEWPYGLERENEKNKFRKFIERTDHLTKTTKHISEDTLDFLADFAVRTREESKGMQGLSPRFFQDTLSRAYTCADKVIDIQNLCDSIVKMFSHKATKDVDPTITTELFEKVKQEYVNKLIERFIKRIVPAHFSDYGQNIYEEYIKAACRKVTGKGATKKELSIVDEVEELLIAKGKISEKGRTAFESLLSEQEQALVEMSYQKSEQLEEVINELVFSKVKNFLRLTVRDGKMDDQSTAIRKILEESLIKDFNYHKDELNTIFTIVGQHI
jgi:predicted Ser/Thr protein kinase